MSKTTTPKTAMAKAGAKRGRKAKVPAQPMLAETTPEVVAVVATEPVAATTRATPKLSGLDAAALVLREAGASMNAQDLVRCIIERGLWTTGGKTPAATIYAAMLREIKVKGDKARFAKVDRGRFAAAG